MSRTKRFRVVDNKSTPLEWPHNTTNEKTRHNNIHGRLRNGLCRSLTDSTQVSGGHEGNLDVTRSLVTFDKRPGTPSDLSYNTRSHKTQKMETQKNFSLHRQYGLKMGHKQPDSKNAGHVRNFARINVEMPKMPHTPDSQSYPRKGQCNGRQSLSQRQRHRRLETTSNSFSA